MKVAVVAESEADEAAVRVLVNAALGATTTPPDMRPIRSRGWTAILGILPAVVKHLHYQTDAVGFVVVLDSDRSSVHSPAHEQPGAGDPGCRLCTMKDVVDRVRKTLAPRQGAPPLKAAFGLATPQVEAWYLVGLDPHVSEAAWVTGFASSKLPYTSQSLKRKAYGSERPSLDLAKGQGVEHTERIVRQGKLEVLERLFPNGFGALARDLRTW